MALRVAVTGASGRMGQAVVRAISTEPETELACLVARPASQLVGSSAASIVGDVNCPITFSDVLDLDSVDVVIDFTLPESSLVIARACADASVPMVIGTTGFSEAEQAEVRASVQNLRRKLIILMEECHLQIKKVRPYIEVLEDHYRDMRSVERKLEHVRSKLLRHARHRCRALALPAAQEDAPAARHRQQLARGMEGEEHPPAQPLP